MANRIGAFGYLECSAKTKEGVREVFEMATRAALQVRKRKKRGGCQLLWGGGVWWSISTWRRTPPIPINLLEKPLNRWLPWTTYTSQMQICHKRIEKTDTCILRAKQFSLFVSFYNKTLLSVLLTHGQSLFFSTSTPACLGEGPTPSFYMYVWLYVCIYMCIYFTYMCQASPSVVCLQRRVMWFTERHFLSSRADFRFALIIRNPCLS